MKSKTIKSIIATVIALTVAILCMPMSMAAEQVAFYAMGNCAGRYYDDGSLVFEGEGELSGYLSEDSDDYNGYDIPWQERQDEITSVTISEGITSCDINMLAYLNVLKEVTFPGRGFAVDENTFKLCHTVEKFIISGESDNYAVDASGAIYDKGMTKLIRYPAGNTAISYTVPSTVKTIGAYAFCDAQNLENIVLPSGLTTIEEGAFSTCTSLGSIDIPDSVDAIDTQAFESCLSISEIVLPEGIKKIEKWTFREMGALCTVVVPKSVTTIDKSCVDDCEAFKEFKYAGSEAEWNKISFSGESDPSTSFDSLKVAYNYQSSATESNKGNDTNTDNDADENNINEHETTKSSDKKKDKGDSDNKNTILIIAIVAVAVVLVIAVAAVVIIKMKK